MSDRTPIVGGNWKMHTTRAEARALFAALRGELDGIDGVEVVICPPAPWIADAADALDGCSLAVGAQNVHAERSGAFTGEVSPWQLAGVASYAIVGHSERRRLFGESDDQTNRKLRAVTEAGLRPILAVGELREEQEAGWTLAILRRQLTVAFEGVETLAPGFVIAYEPVWAIGTGLTATPEIAQQSCAAIRTIVGDRFDEATADACRIQYGGSVNVDNVDALAAQLDIDGALVGGASLDAEAFAAICRAVAAAR